MKRCKFCGQEIDWMTNVEGKSMPMEPEPVFVIEDGGTEVFLDDMGAALIGRQARPEEERRDLPVAFARHWCPWKKGPSRRRTERGDGYGGHLPFPDRRYSVIYADPPWAYRQKGEGAAINHYQTMTTAEICALPVPSICGEGAACFLWATFPNIGEAIRVMGAWGFSYKTAAFVWVKKNRKNGGNFWGMGAYTRANAEVCLLGIVPGFKAKERIQSHRVHQIIEAPYQGHSKKPEEARRRIVDLLGDVPRIELFARSRADGWDAWGNEAPEG